MKVLFLNSSIPNYVTDGLFHGLRSMQGVTVVDMPRMDYMYHDASAKALEKTGSKGNTLYKLLPEPVDVQGGRTFWQDEVCEYDFIVFCDIFEQYDAFHSLYKRFGKEKRASLCVVDGYDVDALFPFFNVSYSLKTRPWAFIYDYSEALYFKREYSSTGALYGIHESRNRLLHNVFSKVLKKPVNYHPISMSIPEEHVEYVPLTCKTKDFVDYNVDGELNSLFPRLKVAELGKWQPTFNSQTAYYQDIRNSKFGVTTKRAGWDCLRHYEYAAKGAILCFKGLELKEDCCAPLGLNSNNCITYNNKEELMAKLNSKSLWELEAIQEYQYRWVKQHTTIKVAQRFLEKLVHWKKRKTNA